MAKQNDTRPLKKDDFRRVRTYLADHVFALAGDGDHTPRDPVSRRTWERLMDLPTDVVLQTSDHLGTIIGDLVSQSDAWMAATPMEPHEAPFLFDAALDASDEFDAAPFIAAHGYFRQATAALRNALEAMVIAARCFSNARSSGLSAVADRRQTVGVRRMC